jgi:hypothetical protein
MAALRVKAKGSDHSKLDLFFVGPVLLDPNPDSFAPAAW